MKKKLQDKLESRFLVVKRKGELISLPIDQLTEIEAKEFLVEKLDLLDKASRELDEITERLNKRLNKLSHNLFFNER